jgi:hypothetical protein
MSWFSFSYSMFLVATYHQPLCELPDITWYGIETEISCFLSGSWQRQCLAPPQKPLQHYLGWTCYRQLAQLRLWASPIMPSPACENWCGMLTNLGFLLSYKYETGQKMLKNVWFSNLLLIRLFSSHIKMTKYVDKPEILPTCVHNLHKYWIRQYHSSEGKNLKCKKTTTTFT